MSLKDYCDNHKTILLSALSNQQPRHKETLRKYKNILWLLPNFLFNSNVESYELKSNNILLWGSTIALEVSVAAAVASHSRDNVFIISASPADVWVAGGIAALMLRSSTSQIFLQVN